MGEREGYETIEFELSLSEIDNLIVSLQSLKDREHIHFDIDQDVSLLIHNKDKKEFHVENG